MNRTERKQFLVLLVIFITGVSYLIATGTLTIRTSKIATDLGITTTQPTAVSGTIFMSPYDARDEVLQFIVDAKYTLDGWFYQITDTDIIQGLDINADSGVQTQLIIERSPYGGDTKSYQNLVKKLDSNPYISIQSDDHLGINFNHTKTFIRDDTQVLIATANLSYPSFSRNREYRVQVSDSELVQSLHQAFNADREGAAIPPSSIHPAVLICPINCRSGLDALLDEVTSSVWLQAQYLSDPIIVSRLLEMERQGIEVRVLLGEFQEKDDLQGLSHRIMMSPYNHSKALLIDQEKLLIGSMNYSTNSIENNREISVLIDSPQAIGLFKWQFEKDWEMSE